MSKTRRALDADLEAGFVDLVDAYGSMVLSIGSRLGDRVSADDIAQETFIRAYHSISRRKNLDGLDLRPWLATIALNVVRNEQRRRIRRPTTPMSVETMNTLMHPGTGTEDSALAVEENGAIDRLLACLPDAQREAVVLRHVVGLNTQETAEVMNCPAGTVKSHLSRGLASLRETLATTNDATKEKT